MEESQAHPKPVTVPASEFTFEPERKPEKQSSSKFVNMFVILSKGTKLLKAIKMAKVLSPLVTFISMALSVFAYSFGMGWTFALGFVGMIFVHELGHVAALKFKGMKASLPVFIPFLGAAVFAPDMKEREDEAHVGYAGPLIGSLGAVVLLLIAVAMDSPPALLVSITFTALFLNLFNMIPLSPIDGGRVAQAIGPWFRYIGIAMLFALTLALRTPGMLVIWMLVVAELSMTRAKRTRLVLGLAAVMIVMMVTGIGTEQHWVINLIDIGLVAFILFIIRIGSDTPNAARDQRVQLSPAKQRKWLAIYLGTVVTLVLLMLYTATLLPVHVVK